MSLGKWFGFGQNADYDEGIRLQTEGKFEDAVAFFEAVVKARDPQLHRQASYYLAECLTHAGLNALRKENYAHAIKFLEPARELHPTFPDVRLNLAIAYRGLRNLNRMQTELSESLTLNPRYARAVFMAGLVKYEEGEPEIGITEMLRAGEIDPLFIGDRFEAGLSNHNLGDKGSAVAHWQVLLMLERSDANAFSRIGDSFAKKALWEQAAAEYERALELAPTYPDIRVKYGQCLLELDQVARAVAEFEKAVEINPKYADAHAFMGVALKRLGEKERARAQFQTAVTLNPDHVIAARELTRLR